MHLAASLLSLPPDPGQGTPPPGVAGPLTTVLSWAAWTVFALAILGILLVAGKMIISHQQGRGGEHGQGLAFVLGGIILAASASALVGVLV